VISAFRALDARADLEESVPLRERHPRRIGDCFRMSIRGSVTGIALLLVTASAVEAAPPALPSSVPVIVTPGPTPQRPILDQRAIFEILCGGAVASSPRLHDHLWQVAGSLAARRWTPPQVTVRVVAHAVPR
jgi:hypothetical protein